MLLFSLCQLLFFQSPSFPPCGIINSVFRTVRLILYGLCPRCAAGATSVPTHKNKGGNQLTNRNEIYFYQRRKWDKSCFRKGPYKNLLQVVKIFRNNSSKKHGRPREACNQHQGAVPEEFKDLFMPSGLLVFVANQESIKRLKFVVALAGFPIFLHIVY